MTHAIDPTLIERAARELAINILSQCAAHYAKPELFSAAFGRDPQQFIDRAIANATEIARAALASIPEAGEEAARAENEWRPVESAPRDGTRILLSLWHFNDPAKGRWEVVGSWIAELGDWASETYERLWPPTHWRPLPPPPTEPTK